MDAMNLVVLMCAVLAALALGVLLAYGFCQLLFSALKMHVRSMPVIASRKPAETQVAPAAS